MSLHIHNAEADRLARELASRKGISIEDAVLDALRERAHDTFSPIHRAIRDADDVYEKIMEISKRASKLPVYDSRTAEEILYDENGLPF